jgi:methanogenic corrinoid protein MtbC1
MRRGTMDNGRSSAAVQLIDELESALLSMDRDRCRRCFERSEVTPLAFAEWIVAVALERIGASWERGEVALAQVYMSGRICEDLINAILPPDQEQPATHPPMAIAALDDFHPLGKRIVTAILRSNGFHLADFGQVAVVDLIAKVQEHQIRILLISTLMLPSALRVKEVRKELDRLGLDVKLMVGGAPFRFDPTLWQEVGADATCDSASGAVKILWQLTEGITWKP